MIDRDFTGGPIILRCDGCAPEFIETGERVFTQAIDVARRTGWQAKHQGASHGWCHYCPECSEAEKWETQTPIRSQYREGMR